MGRDRESHILKSIAAYLAILLTITGFTFICKYSIVQSGIHFDFEQLLSLQPVSYIVMFALIALLILLFSITYRLTIWVKSEVPKNNTRILIAFIVLLLFVPVIDYLQLGIPIFPFFLGVFAYMILADLYIIKKDADITWLISWMIILSSLSSILIFNYYLKEDVIDRLKIADGLVEEPDPTVINAINAFSNEVKSDTFVQNLLSVPYPFKIHKDEFSYIIDEKLQHQKILADHYSVILNVFDQLGNPLVYDQFTPLAYYLEQQNGSDQVNEDLYFDPIQQSYLWRSEFVHTSYPNSPLVLFYEFQNNSILKNPEVMLTYTYDKAYSKPSYAIYKNKRLVKAFGNDFSNNLNIQGFPVDEDYFISIENGRSNLYYQKDNNTVVHLARKTARLIKPISLFSFLFVLLGICIIFISVVNHFSKILPDSIPLKFNLDRSLRKRLQLSFIILIIVSFIIIGFITLYYFQYLSTDYNNDLLTEKTVAITADVQARIQFSKDAEEAIHAIASNIYTISKTHQSDVHFYDHLGDLINSSSPKLFEFDLLPQNLGVEIISHFQSGSNNVHISNQASLHSLTYKSVTIPISFDANNILGYLNLNFAPQIKAQNNVADFVGTLLNVYVFLFLFAGAIALAMANSITRPIAVLGENLRSFKLGKNNKLLEWENNDELGELIHNYNNMVEQLDESAKFMAKTEREMAWREMARQVAHEIKNPLTPMKLYIQQIQRAIKNGEPNLNELIQKVSHTLIEQINALSQIATEFSNFGTMPRADNEKIILNEVVEAVHDLFRKREDITINLIEPFEELYVFADKNQMIRVLNNIVKNAIQAIPSEDYKGEIEIKLYKEKGNAVIKVSDNGMGIPDHMKEKIFTPNFTTKSSGTGLGLAISANIMEAFDGRLYFETEYGKGTQFFIELPLMYLEDNFKKENRVDLDEIQD